MYGEALHVPLEYVNSHNMLLLNDLFSLSEACLLADVVQLVKSPLTRTLHMPTRGRRPARDRGCSLARRWRPISPSIRWR